MADRAVAPEPDPVDLATGVLTQLSIAGPVPPVLNAQALPNSAQQVSGVGAELLRNSWPHRLKKRLLPLTQQRPHQEADLAGNDDDMAGAGSALPLTTMGRASWSALLRGQGEQVVRAVVAIAGAGICLRLGWLLFHGVVVSAHGFETLLIAGMG